MAWTYTHLSLFHYHPVYFDKLCKFTIEHGHNNNLTLDLSSVAYWYQDHASMLPHSFTRAERVYKPIIGPADIHKWRDAWRIEEGNKSQLWGNEEREK